MNPRDHKNFAYSEEFTLCTRPDRKISNLIFFFENLVDYNEARLHKATLNLHTDESADGQKHLSGVMFSAVFGL